MHFWRSILLLVFLGCSELLEAQWRGPQLTRLGPSEGLATSILDFTQDSVGYLYMGSNTGMYRYDGQTFEFFGHDPLNAASVSPGDVSSIHASESGLIWLTTSLGGLDSFDPETKTFRHYPFPARATHIVPGAHGLYEDEKGVIWVGGPQFTLYAYNPSVDTFATYIPEWIDQEKDPRRLNVLSIMPDRFDSCRLWLSVLDYSSDAEYNARYGIVSFDVRTSRFEDHPCFGHTRYIDAKGRLWGSLWGDWFMRYDPKTQDCDSLKFQMEFDGQPLRPLTWDVISYQGDILLSSSLGLLQYQSDQTLEVIAQPVTAHETFHSLFKDRDDNLWIGSRQGAYVLDPGNQHIRFFSLARFGFRERIYPGRLAYHGGSNKIFLSQPNSPDLGYLYEIPLERHTNVQARALYPGVKIGAITCDNQDRIWLYMDGALHVMNPVTHHVERMHLSNTEAPLPSLQILSAHRNGWIGAHGRNDFFWFHTDTLELHRISLSQFIEKPVIKDYGNRFHGFFLREEAQAFLFSNTPYLVDLVTDSIIELKYDPVFNPKLIDIQSVVEDSAGNIWMSSFSMLGKYQLSGDSLVLLDAFTTGDGLVSPIAIELHIDRHQRVWTFMISGVNAIDPETREVRFFGTKQGLPDSWNDPVQVLTLKDGSIATVSSNGLIVFDPDKLWSSGAPTSETIVIEEIRIAGEPLVGEENINTLERLNLKPKQSVVDIAFQGLAFPTDDNVEYSYRIIGLQNDWISLGKNSLVTLPDLSPGEYTLQIKTGKPNSNSPVRALAIYMATPFYSQWWFVLSSVLLAGAVLFALVQWRVRKVRKQEKATAEVNKKMAELELKALRSQMNPHFMFNSLNSIKNYILHAEPKLAAEYLSNFAHLIRMILQNSREKSISLKDELETLVLYVELEKLRFDDAFEFTYHVDEDIQLEAVKIPPMLLQPYVENAIWHGLMHKGSRGHLLLHFRKSGSSIACIIDDDGVGRVAAQKMKSLSATKYKSMGMGITKDRIEIMNKMDALGITTEIIDKHDDQGTASGTRVIVHIPAAPELESEI